MRALAALSMAASLMSCSLQYDRDAELSKRDYQELMRRQAEASESETKPAPEPPIPEMQPLLAAPMPPDGGRGQLVTISVTEETPLKDVLIELARKAEIDLELGPDIRGGIVFMAHERPLEDVIRRIANLAGLRYTFKDDVLRVEVDSMYHRSYRINQMNMVRSASSSVSTSTDVFSAVAGGSGGGAGAGGNGSRSQVQMESLSDFWNELDANIDQILKNAAPRRRMSTAEPPVPPPVRVVQPQMPTEPGDTATSSGRAAEVMRSAREVIDQTTAAVESAGSQPEATAQASAAPAAPAETQEPQFAPESYFSINKQAGIISVYGNSRQHEQIEAYIEKVVSTLSSQVLIEAKVLEVRLDDAYRSGINWRSLAAAGTGFTLPLGSAFGTLPTQGLPFNSATSGTPDILTIASEGKDLSALVSLIEEFGTVRTLSSPRVTVMNNQTAVLKVAENEVYFRMEIDTTTTDAGTETTVESELNTVPIGLVMTVQPVVDADSDHVTLSLRPTVSRISRRINDPAVAFAVAKTPAAASIKSEIPVVEVRELDSVVSIASGQVVVMGGLMQDSVGKEAMGVPFASDVPLVGELFKARNDATELTELVIFLRATIVRGPDSIHPADKELYRRFSRDPRPLAF